MSALTDATVFLTNIVFDSYIMVLILRLLMQKLGASYYNPVSQFVIRITNVFVSPLQRIMPGFKGFDFAIVLLLIIFALIQAFLLFWFRFGILPFPQGCLLMTIGGLGNQFVNFYFYSIILRSIMSWVIPLQNNPMADIIYLVTEPIMRPFRQFVPRVAGLDFSPIVLLVLLQLISILIFNPLITVGFQAA